MTSRAKILYIEDDRGSQRLVQRVLESHGFTVLVAEEGLSGIRVARLERPNLVLMDINLPGMNGREITTRLRGLTGFQNVPIVALSANTGISARERALAAGCNGFLTKPIDIVRFPHEIQEFLSGRIEYLSDRERLYHLEQHAQGIVSRLEDKIHELQEANRHLREIDRIKSNFITLVSHELRTPLTLIEGYAHLLFDHVQKVEPQTYPDELVELVMGMETGIDRLSKTIGEVVSISRIASGTLELALSPVRLQYIVDMVMREVRRMTQNRALEVNIRGLHDLPPIEADSIQLSLAMQNIVENAIKFTPDGGRISIVGRQLDENSVDLMIEDTGIGIPPAELNRIFDQFHILGVIEHHTSSKSAFRGGGLGLGLPIARGIIEAHNGRIWVDSNHDRPDEPTGSCFHLLLPITQPPK